MPIYEYECNECKHPFLRILAFKDRDSVTCPKCQSDDVARRISLFSSGGHDCGGEEGGRRRGGGFG